MRRDAATVRRRLAALPALCREAGLEPTPQRRSVYEVLLRAEDHPSPEAIYTRLRPRTAPTPKGPALSLATVYKALDALLSIGVVREVSRLGRTRRFDANVDPHQHLSCARCDMVLDFHDDRLSRLAVPRRIRGVAGFTPREVRVEIVGLCARCARKGRDDDAGVPVRAGPRVVRPLRSGRGFRRQGEHARARRVGRGHVERGRRSPGAEGPAGA